MPNKLVVDANVVISSLLTNRHSSVVFKLNSIFNKFNFVAPEFLLTELEKHKNEFFRKSKLSKEDFQHGNFIFNFHFYSPYIF